MGPAHTRGDTLVYVPADRLVFTGDILFVGSHPIMWEGPLENWICACNALLGLDVDIVVPGHGPLTDKSGVRAMRDYWVALDRAVQAGHAAGASAPEIARSLIAGHARAEPERLVVSVDTALRELASEGGSRDPLLLLAQMAEFANSKPSAAARLAAPRSARSSDPPTRR